MSDTRIATFQDRGLWIAVIQSSLGPMEFLCGEGEKPDSRKLAFLEEFMKGAETLIRIRKSVFKIPILWRPIRLAINNQGRMGVQFKNRLTGAQRGMFWADEHSEFKNRLDRSGSV